MTNQRGSISSKLPIVLLIGSVLILASISALLFSCSTPTPTEVAANRTQVISPSDYRRQFSDSVNHVLIDVRTPEEFTWGYIRDAINISVESLPDRLNEVPTDLPVVVYCRSGRRSAIAAEILVSAGFQPVYDLGGIQSWIADGFPVEYQ